MSEAKSMGDPLEEYKAFIDGLLGWPRTSVMARWAREWGDGQEKTYRVPPEFGALMAGLTAEHATPSPTCFKKRTMAGYMSCSPTLSRTRCPRMECPWR